MSRINYSVFERFTKNLFLTHRARRSRRAVKRQDGNSSCQHQHDSAISIVDLELEDRILLSAITVSADDVQAPDILIASVDESDASADFLTVNAGIRVESTGGSVTLNAGDDLNLLSGSIIAANTSVNLGLDVGDADSGSGSTATLQNTFSGTIVNITGGLDNDTVNLSPSSFKDVPLSIDLLAGTSNSLSVSLTGVTAPVLTYTSATSGTITSSNHATITFSNVQTVDVAASTGSFSDVRLDINSLPAGGDNSADSISLVRNGVNVNVAVNGSSVLQVPQADAAKLSLIGSSDDDSFIIDHSSGLITVPVVVDGGSGDDQASIVGNGTETSVYSPDATTTGSGVVTVSNAGSLTFSGLEPVDIQNMSTATLTLPGANDILTVSEGVDFQTGSNAALIVAGSSGGVTFETVAFRNNGSVVIDTNSNSGTDTISVTGAANAHGNQSLTIATGGLHSDGDLLNLSGDIAVVSQLSISGAAVNLQDDVALSAGTSVAFTDATVNGDHSFQVTGGTSVAFENEIGGTTALATFTVGSTGSSFFEDDITATGAITINNDAIFDGDLDVSGTSVTLRGDVVPGENSGDVQILAFSNSLVLSNQPTDELSLEVTGKSTAGTDFDQLLVSGSVVLAGALTLDGTFADTGTAGDEIVLIANDGSDAVSGTFSNYSNGQAVTLNGETWRLLYDGGDGNDVSLRFGTNTGISVANAFVAEGDSGNSQLSFDVTSTTAIGSAFRVTYATADNTAESSSDYTASNSVLSFAGTTSGETQTVTIDVSGDDLVERTETLLLTLTNILDTSDATFTDSIGIGTISNDDAATVTIGDVSIAEGDSGTSALTFTATLDSNVDTGFSFNYATSDDSATVANSDYSATSGTLTFVGMATEFQTFSVDITGDTTAEFDEAFTAILSSLNTSGRNVVLGSTSATGTIIDDDRVPVQLSLSTSSGTESGQSQLTITATADEAVTGAQTVSVQLSGLGISASDYSLSSATIQIPDNATSGSVTLTVTDDDIVELTEMAVVALSNPSGGIRIGETGSGQFTIASDDSATLTIASASVAEGDSGTTDVTFQVTLDKAVDSAITVDFATADGTATVADGDYVATNGTLTFSGGAGEIETVTVTVNSDEVVELNEVFLVALSGLDGSDRPISLTTSSTSGTITNDDQATVSIADVTATENDTGTSTFDFVVTLSHAVDANVTMLASTADGTATSANSDYAPRTDIPVGFIGSVGEEATFSVTVNGDRFVETDEVFSAVLASLQASSRDVIFSDNTASGTISNDDAPVPVNIAANVLTGSEAAGTVITLTITADEAVGGDQTVELQLSGIDSTDAQLSATTVTIPHGQTTGTATLTILNDDVVEAIESATMTLTNLSAGLALGATPSASISIVDNDSATININDVSISEGDSGATNFEFTVSLTSLVDGPLSLNYQTASSTALSSDFTATSGSLTFPALSTDAQTITVSVSGDELVELDEEFLVNLSNLSASGLDVTFSDNQGKGTIENDDQATLSVNDVSVKEGNAGTSVYSFNVTLSHDVDSGVSADYSTTDGTAVAPADYTAISSNTVVFSGNAGEIETIQVLVTAETLAEADETFFIDLLSVNASGRDVVIDDGRGTGTIVDDDGIQVNLSASSAAGSEAGTTSITLTATAASAVSGSQGVPVQVTGDRITESDYSLSETSITIPNGQTTGSVTFTVADDDLTEILETATVTISNFPVALSAGTTTSVDINISDDDQTTLTVGDVTVTEGDSGTTVATFTLTADTAADAPFSIDYATADGTATSADGDYTSVSATTLNFTGVAGQQTMFSVDVLADEKVELDESFVVNLLNLQSSGRNIVLDSPTATGSITNDDAATLSVADFRQVEGDSGSTTFAVDVTLSAAVDASVSIDYSTSDVTAEAGTDYTAVSGATLVFVGTADEIQTAMITVTGDTVAERDESLVLMLSNLVVAGERAVSIDDGSAEITIADDDGIVVNFGTNSTAGFEADQTVITLVASALTPVNSSETVDLIVTGTGIDGNDYSLSSTTIMIAAGQTIGTTTLTILDDNMVEDMETLVVSIANPTEGLSLGSVTEQSISITSDDDGTVPVNISSNLSVATEADQTTITITVTADQAVAGDQSVTIAISGTDITASDYSLSSTTLIIPDQQTTGSVTLQVLQDSIFEASVETLTATVTSPSAGLTLGTTTSVDIDIQENTTVQLDDVDRYQDSKPTLTWQEVPGAVGYEVWFSRIFPQIAVLEIDRDVTGTSWEVPSELDPAFYRYWVRAKDADGTFGAWSVPNQFEVRPVLISPIGGSYIGVQTFQWEPIPGATAYELYLDTANGIERIENITETSYTPSSALPDGKIRWWIRAEESLGNRGWSAEGNAGSEVQPVGLTPQGATTDSTPTFTWSFVPGAGRYVLFIQNMDTSEVIVDNASVTGVNYTPTESLASGNYRFWVKAIDAETDAFNSGFWSLPVDFSVSEVESGEHPIVLVNLHAELPEDEQQPSKQTVAPLPVVHEPNEGRESRPSETEPFTGPLQKQNLNALTVADSTEDQFAGLVDLLMQNCEWL